MWDVNPQAHAFYLRDIDRQFTAKATARQSGSRRNPWSLSAMWRFAAVATQGAAACVALYAFSGLIFG